MESFRFLAVMLSWMVLGTVVSCAGSVVLTQTHPAAPYVCRTGNITLRCQYDDVKNVVVVLWSIGGQTTSNASTILGHTALPRTTTYQEVVVDSYTNLAAGYGCAPTLSNGTQLLSNPYNPQYESAEVTLSNLTLASRTATTLSVTWSAGYPKCYFFTVSHSTQDGSITVTQPADSTTVHTLSSLQPGTTYRIEVEAVRKGDRADGQRAKVMGSFMTEGEAPVPSSTTSTVYSSPIPSNHCVASTCPHTTVTVTVLSVILSLVLTLLLSTCAVSAVVHAVMYKRLQRCRAELRGGGGDSVQVGPGLEGEGPPTREEEKMEEEGEKMQANPAYLPIEMSYKSQESKYINVPS